MVNSTPACYMEPRYLTFFICSYNTFPIYFTKMLRIETFIFPCKLFVLKGINDYVNLNDVYHHYSKRFVFK